MVRPIPVLRRFLGEGDFTVDDAVVVRGVRARIALDINGFYGVVTSLTELFVYVRLDGCDSARTHTADYAEIIEETQARPFPFLRNELRHRRS